MGIAVRKSGSWVGDEGPLTKTDVGLGNVDNTSDVNKPVSTAQQTALDLKLDIAATKAASTTNVRSSKVTGDANNRHQQDAAGKIEWGGGSGAVDTNLYRGTAGQLKTDGSLIASASGAGVTTGAVGPSSKGGIAVGLTSDTVWYRDAADTWRTADAVIIDGAATLNGTSTATTQSAGDNSTKLATTAYADAKVSDTAYAGSWDAVTGIAPSKNAVYDQMQLREPLAHRVYIDAMETPFSGQFDSWNTTTTNPHVLIFNSASAQNDEAVWKPSLAAGTWRIDLLHYERNNRPIYTFALSDDGSSYTDVGTIDGYSSGSTGIGTIARESITGISVTTGGLKYLRVKLATKNASSSTYSAAIAAISLTKTA